ncbi:MAG: hypothetical protein Q4P36_05400 [Bowdeniella nasicola]|nr:hypothetical protein [Bowdeniella nasicola]
MRGHAEDGRITLLTIGLLGAILMIGYAVIAASAIHLERKHLQDLSETLAVRASSAVDERSYLEAQLRAAPTAPEAFPVNDEATMHAALDAHLARLEGRLPDDLQVVEVARRGSRVSVQLSATARPPLLPDWLWPVRITVRSFAEIHAGSSH